MSWLLSIFFLISPSASADDTLTLDNYKGKVVYLDFWASWCGPCKESFPWLNQIQQKYKDKGLVVIGINVDKEKQKADEFLKQNSASFPIIYNASGSLAKQFGVKGMPYSILIGKDGKQLHSHIGFQNSKAQEYSQIIEGALK